MTALNISVAMIELVITGKKLTLTVHKVCPTSSDSGMCQARCIHYSCSNKCPVEQIITTHICIETRMDFCRLTLQSIEVLRTIAGITASSV